MSVIDFCGNNGGRAIGAGHECLCNYKPGHARRHGCECGAIWDSGQLRTSEEWQKLKPKIQVLDPDGWDRQNFEYSWHQERITEAEYDHRIMMSTVGMAPVMMPLNKPQIITDKKFSAFNDELIDRYFNNAGKDDIKAYMANHAINATNELEEFLRAEISHSMENAHIAHQLENDWSSEMNLLVSRIMQKVQGTHKALEYRTVEHKEDLPHDDLYEILVNYRNTPIHLWTGSDSERTRLAYNALVRIIKDEHQTVEGEK